MNYLTLENVTKTYGDKVLFENVTLHINHGDKVALVAKNGTGKTTLLRLIAGHETGEGEKYTILLHKGIRVGYLQQDPQFINHWTVMETVFDSENPLIQAIKDYEIAMLHPENDSSMQQALSKWKI